MKIQKKAHPISIRVVFLLAILCILTFFCSTAVYVHAAPVDSKSDISEANGSSQAEVQDPDSPQDFQFILGLMREVPAYQPVCECFWF